MTEDYEAFKAKIKANERIEDYNSQLLVHRQSILEDIQERNQGVVARDLNMSQSRLSILVPFLRALNNDEGN